METQVPSDNPPPYDQSGRVNRETSNAAVGVPVEQEKLVYLDTSGGTATLNMSPSTTQSLLSTANGSDKKLLSPEMVLENEVPSDSRSTVYYTFVLHGIGVLMAWNMFITANSYFVDYKLAIVPNSTYAAEVSNYRSNFLSYLGLAAQIPNVICNAINLFSQSKTGNMTFRVTAMIAIELVVCVLTLALAFSDSSGWQGAFFYITMISVVIMNMASGIYQSSIYGVAGKLPMKYSNAVMLGANVSGTLVSIFDIVSKALAGDPRTSGLIYFVLTLAILIACLISFNILPLNKFYQHYDKMSKQTSVVKEVERETTAGQKLKDYLTIFKEIWPQCLNVFMVFFVTLSVFPAVTANVQSSGQLEGLGDYFTPVTCFLLFNATAMFGNMLTGLIIFPGPGKLFIPVFARLLFMPFFLLCNYRHNERNWPILFANDWIYVIGGALLGLSSGYYSSLSMMYAPRAVKDPSKAGTAAMMASFFLMLGLFFGVNGSFVMAKLVQL